MIQDSPSGGGPSFSTASSSGPQVELLERLRRATLGEYEILGELGTGGMATVYLAHDLALDRKVAIKVMSPMLLYGPGMAERFRREARTAAALSHPNIIPIYRVREAEGLLFFVMKLVQGTPLDAVIKELGPLPIPTVEAILAQVGSAVGYAHRHGIVHRDIKPGNILIDEEGWAVVTDFGIAKVLEADALTLTGMAVGTPTYMSPEQCEGGEITGASDQYSLGVVAYEMLAGRPPFRETTVVALMLAHATREPPALPELRADCPESLRRVVERMLAKNPAARWPSLESAVSEIGARHLAHDDPSRTKLIEVAKTGVGRRLIAEVQTPRSPIPLGRTAETPAPPAPTGGRARPAWLV
ncbi:MAG TPA: serine/threonine-protein kinase, partial [Gemmatimonadales bacterium]